MPAKRKPARRTAPARRRKPVSRARPSKSVKVPRSGPIHARIGAWMALKAADQIVTHKDTVRSRQDAAILRATHEGCTKCGGNGQIFTKGKDGSFSGSKPCPAKPTKTKVSKWAVYKNSRFGSAKKTGLVGCSCPCGWKQKPRFRDAKEATKVLRTHEKAKHGGKTVGGAWYAQTAAAPTTAPEAKPALSKVVTDSGMTDQQWIKQNKKMKPGTAISKGLCWMCVGNGKLHGGQQTLTVCRECKGTGKAATKVAA